MALPQNLTETFGKTLNIKAEDLWILLIKSRIDSFEQIKQTIELGMNLAKNIDLVMLNQGLDYLIRQEHTEIDEVILWKAANK